MVRCFVPLSLMLYLYKRITHAIYKEQYVRSAFDIAQNKQRRSQDQGILKIIRVVTLVFAASVVPAELEWMFCNVVLIFNPPLFVRLYSNNTYMVFVTTIRITFYMNAVMNCFVYAGYFKDFRSFLLRRGQPVSVVMPTKRENKQHSSL